ncbi:MAG: hypothetical protein AUG51_01305 [Acidobacteria bacterium 13_1_20CM_3_53_8]|nr:MAG: hypothetical protein AUG51_01305 [Acidobacteria bacterium 13_1_20CM_3_53_8]
MFIILLSFGISIGAVSGAPTKIVTGPDMRLVPQVNTYSPTGATTDSFFADNPSFTGGIRVAMGNIVTTNDIITGSGPGAGPVVKVFRGSNHNLVYSFFAFAPTFNLGIFVAAGDVNGDGRADIIVGAGDGNGSSPNVRVFSGADGTTVLKNFFAFDVAFTGGVRVAAGDVNGDGIADIIAGTGPGAAQVTVFSGKDLSVLKNFIAYPNFTGGVFVAAGDVNGDGLDDIITGTGTGVANVKVFSGKDGSLLQNFFAFPGATGGVRVAASDLNGDGVADVITATGPGDTSQLRAFNGTTLSTLIDFMPYGSSTAGVFPGAIPRFPPQSLNISTRANVLTGDNVVIGGFIITGTDQKNVIIRGIGPSSGVPGALADPTLELYNGSTLLATNNNWRDTQETVIQQSGLPPGNNLESAIVRLLSPGTYTAILRGNGGGTGIGLVEAYDLDAAVTNSQLANISTRGLVQNGNDVMIAGIILGGGTGTNRILVRGLGPSLSQFGVSNPLSDPTLGLFNSQGTLLRGNDNWKQTQEADIRATGIPPSNDLESALIAVLPAGNYTAIVGGTAGITGVGLVEIYNLQ